MSPWLLEPLESREFLSVSATMLAEPLTKGTTRVEVTTAPGSVPSTTSSKVIGTATVAGVKTVRVDSTLVQDTTTNTSRAYSTVDNVKGDRVVQEKRFDHTSGVTITTTTTFSPPAVFYPKSLAPGVTYKTKWKGTSAVSTPGRTPTIAPLASSWTVKLLSQTRATVHVPAGTFKAYVLVLTSTATINGKKHTTTFKQWVAPGVGQVQETSTSDGHTFSTTQLQSYHIGG